MNCGGNKFLEDFIKLRKDLKKPVMPDPVTGDELKYNNKKEESEKITVAYICEHKPKPKVVREYFKALALELSETA